MSTTDLIRQVEALKGQIKLAKEKEVEDMVYLRKLQVELSDKEQELKNQQEAFSQSVKKGFH